MNARIALLLALALPFSASAEITGKVIKIGVLNDQSGLYADLAGQGSVAAAKMAAEDSGGKIGDATIEVIFADHQNKPDVGSGIAREWYDTKGVDVIVDVPTSSVALAVSVTWPSQLAVTVLLAEPADTVTAPRPVRSPGPAVRAQVTDVELSEVTTLFCASSTATVKPRVAPSARLAVPPAVNARCVGAPELTVSVALPTAPRNEPVTVCAPVAGAEQTAPREVPPVTESVVAPVTSPSELSNWSRPTTV